METNQNLSKEELSKDELATLCRIHTRNDWPLQREMVVDALRRNLPAATDVIRQHVRDEQAMAAEADANVNRQMGNTVSDSVRFSYDYWKNLARTIREGNEALQGLLKQ